MINETLVGGKNNGQNTQPIKTFPEQYEINLRKIVQRNLLSDNMSGLVVVLDLDGLMFDIMEFHENYNSRKR